MFEKDLSVSILIPTLNSAGTLSLCLDAVGRQNYPHGLMEVIVADGGSKDRTLEIVDKFARQYAQISVRMIPNPLKTGEAGKAIALKYARGEVIALIDSDNVLESDDWLSLMIDPFLDPRVVASEPIRYTYQREDGYITRYCALLGMNDPLCYFLGNFDRECILSGSWTGVPYRIERQTEGFLSLRFTTARIPTIGANGFLIRRCVLQDLGIGDYLFDIDILPRLFHQGSEWTVAKVKIGIKHIFCGNWKDFYRKQSRRVHDFLYYKKKGQRRYEWGGANRRGLVYFIFSCLFLIPLIFQSLKGFIKSKDPVFFLHPFFCEMTFIAYALGCLTGGGKIFDRREWNR